MPRFQLEIAIVLAVSALGSASTIYFTRPKDGKIQLPTLSDEDGIASVRDPFDVTKPEDLIDGHPIEGEGFWKRMQRRKLIVSFLLGVVFVLSALPLALSITNANHYETALSGLLLFFAFYLLVIAIRSVSQDETNEHSKSIIHLATLLTFATGLLTLTAILPQTPRPVTQSDDYGHFVKIVSYVIDALFAVACVLVYTTPQGPPLHFPPTLIYSRKTVDAITNTDQENVCGVVGASPWGIFFFSYITKVIWLGNTAESLEIGDLPLVPVGMRAAYNYTRMKRAMQKFHLKIFSWKPRPGSGLGLAYKLIRLNRFVFIAEMLLSAISAVLFYIPAIFLQMMVAYFEADRDRKNPGWGWVYVVGVFMSNVATFLITNQLWSLATTTIQIRLKVQLNTILFAKTLVRKDIASSAPPAIKAGETSQSSDSSAADVAKSDDDDFSSKSQVMTLMTTDVDRICEFAWHVFAFVDSPIEIMVGTIFLYKLLGVSCFYGFGVIAVFLPLNHFAQKIIMGAQENLMKARDERVALMNEILGGIRMLKFMAWERSFEARVLKVREKELKHQRTNYMIESLWTAIWNGAPIIVAVVSFWHFAVVREQILTASIAFPSIIVFTEMKFALGALPNKFISLLQSLVSLRRIEKYLNSAEITPVPPLDQQSQIIALRSCTVTWPQDRVGSSKSASAASTPKSKFSLVDLKLDFPRGELSLICGKLGSGKTLLLLALLGEADVLAGQVLCPRSPPDALASFSGVMPTKEDWIIDGICAYVPQATWLRNESIRDNILFKLPYDPERYQKTLEVCALLNDLQVLEDGDDSEIGERGVNLSGGQKARVSLARAVYSRASILLLDDVLSAVDAHTAHHLYHECLRGELMQGRTIILVSHHVQLCAPQASYIVALDNGRVQFEGSREAFYRSTAVGTIMQSSEQKEQENVQSVHLDSIVDDHVPSTISAKEAKKSPRKLVEDEQRAVGRISQDTWRNYFSACGTMWYWALFLTILVIASVSPVLENSWLRYWSSSTQDGKGDNPVFYISIYAGLTAAGLVFATVRWFVLYAGSLHASTVLYQRLLKAVLFANIRFHDTVSRGRLLNRFGKDFEGIDSSLSENFGRSLIYALSAVTTLITVSFVGGTPFIIAAGILGTLYFNIGKIYGQTARDMRRLDSVARSPLYSIYGETISGAAILRAFGASSTFLRDMLRCVDTNINPYYWLWGVNRWMFARFTLLSSAVVGCTALVCMITPSISPSMAGFALAFANSIIFDLLLMLQHFVGLEQSMVAVERVKEYSDLPQEPAEFIEPRPAASWPAQGAIKCEDLVIRYAPDLPDVLHRLNFEIHPGEKVGILGRTGSGKSTLALSFFRFVEPTEGRILVDGIDTTKIGLTDLRSRLTIIPQDPTILSGSLRSTLDVFDEYEDAEIYESLRRVHLIPSEDTPAEGSEVVNANVFRDLDSTVSEGGENFSTGEKQLLCMARAILKRSKILVMDEATASVDYATDELIGKTIRQEFADSTILTIAHRLRTVIDYDRVMLLDQGRIVEFDRPSVLLNDSSSKFYALCKATGRDEFSMLQKMVARAG
ncbi:multidrug resistance-associated ABC transporter [Crucibulum laeve]|uniref:Multidrug resistance-associated ABC transporter n=1 Tax=Crucibulum laeve TaxID=68775 RepID=A0A5C3LNW4_9AGAR|nr:multidrug resistance-associated ABC transporter [Crucibulum laeve]